MIKILLIVGFIFIGFSIAMFVVDFLPVDFFQNQSDSTYLKIVPTETSSFSWSHYRVHALVLGLVLLGIAKYMGGV
ncbi:MAG: hypothetical protein ABJV04_01695 [Aliiglaciecola sp.]|uniref:hypothetical protein n=1 Tax=Aliiglaciecola sp. TaxID=1872441 RepID=UPI00329918B0